MSTLATGRAALALAVAFCGFAFAQEDEHAGHDVSSTKHGSMQHAEEQSAPPGDHVAPPPPEHPMPPMDEQQMIEAMDMDDKAKHAMLRFDRLEYADTAGGAAAAWSAQAWIGGEFDKLRLRSEGERARGETAHADVEALWSHAIAAYWDAGLGVRHDIGDGPSRNWAAFGVQGLAPWWFEVDATAYVGGSGRSALRVEVDYDLSLTQRWILQPRVEMNAYGKDDAAARIGSGLSDATLGVRLRYEIRREIAPYVGIEWTRRFGGTADFARASGDDPNDARFVAGLRIWY